MIDRLEEIPVVGAVATIVVDLLYFGGDLVVSAILSIGEIIPILSMLSAYVAPQVDFIPTSAISTALLVSALLYIGVSVARLVVPEENNG